MALMLMTAGMEGQVDRTQPPPTPPMPDYKLPPTFETRLPNGLTVVLLEDRRFPMTTIRLGFQAGTKYDPKEIPGLSEMVAALLTEGTRTRTSRQLAEELAAIGGTLSGGSGPDGLTLAGNALSEYTPKLLALVADVARNASFPEQEIALRVQNRKQELQAQRSQPSFLADERLSEIVFGDYPYAHIAPTMDSLNRVDRKTLVAFQERHLAPNNAFLVVLGRIPPREETLKLVNEHFGGWQRKEPPAPPKAEFPESSRKLALVDRPGSVQADIHTGRLAVNRAHADYFPLLVAQYILGGGASSRMFMSIREKHGFAYDAHSELDARRDAGLFAAVTQVRNEVIEPALQAVFDEMNAMVKAPVPEPELTRTKNFISGLFVMRLETQNGLANQLIALKLLGLPNSYLELYTARVRGVTPERIQEVARKYMTPDKAAVVVVGDASKLSEPLAKFGEFNVTKAK